MIFIIFEKWSGISHDPVGAQKNQVYHLKDHQKLWGYMSRLINLMNFIRRFYASKGLRESLVEEPPLSHLAAPCDLEENASHHT